MFGVNVSTFDGNGVRVLSVSLSVLVMVDRRVGLSKILRLGESYSLFMMAFLLLTGRKKDYAYAVLMNGMISYGSMVGSG